MNDSTKSDERRDEGVETPSVDIKDGEMIYILVDGLKSGPFSKEQICEMVETHDLLVTDSVSVNGSEWFNLHQWSAFDRRASHQEELPGLPQVNLFMASDKEVDDTLINKNESLVERDAMAGLAYLGNIKSGKKVQHHSDKQTAQSGDKVDLDELPEIEHLEFEKQSSKKDTYVWGAVLSFALVGILYVFMPPGKSNKVAAKKVETKKSAKIATRSAKKPAKINNRAAKRAANRKIVKARKKKTSFSKSKAFKNRAPRRKPASRKIEKPVVEDPDDYYYDDGTDPVELDPVRSKIAKETFDPDDEEADEYLDELDAEREPAGEEDPEKAFEALYE